MCEPRTQREVQPPQKSPWSLRTPLHHPANTYSTWPVQYQNWSYYLIKYRLTDVIKTCLKSWVKWHFINKTTAEVCICLWIFLPVKYWQNILQPHSCFRRLHNSTFMTNIVFYYLVDHLVQNVKGGEKRNKTMNAGNVSCPLAITNKNSNLPFQPPPDWLPWRCRPTVPATPSSRSRTRSRGQDLQTDTDSVNVYQRSCGWLAAVSVVLCFTLGGDVVTRPLVALRTQQHNTTAQYASKVEVSC